MNEWDTWEFVIDTSVPVPKKEGPGRRCKYPFRKLTKVGNSFFIPLQVAPKSLQVNLNHWKKAYPHRNFIQRVVTEHGAEGIRVWRTK
jgi:hypothetical protein